MIRISKKLYINKNTLNIFHHYQQLCLNNRLNNRLNIKLILSKKKFTTSDNKSDR